MSFRHKHLRFGDCCYIGKKEMRFSGKKIGEGMSLRPRAFLSSLLTKVYDAALKSARLCSASLYPRA